MGIFKDVFGEGGKDTILEENNQLRKKRKHDKEDYEKFVADSLKSIAIKWCLRNNIEYEKN